ncbi:MAG: LytTR family DNA-binding domain-containing protein [Clostridia bacterium]|nr:LytTR family DNA-binding domain-containing protein [Clostridia bacterium]
MLKIAVVENEADQAEEIKRYISRYAADSGEPCDCSVFLNGVDFLTDYPNDYDAVFLDIDMPIMDGMTIAERLRAGIDQVVSIIFVTNLARFALKGYKVNALDFLVKPVGYFEVASELKKISGIKKDRMNEMAWFMVNNTMQRVPYADILYIEVISHYLYIHTKAEVISFRGALKDITDKLDMTTFSRCHNSFIVNLRYVVKVDSNALTVTLEGVDRNILISRSRKKGFLDDLMTYIGKNGSVKFAGAGGTE